MTTQLDTDTAGAVLAGVRSERQAELEAQATQLELAVTWADLHPAESIVDAACFGDTPVPVAGPGAPLVARFSIAEFATAMGVPTEVGASFLGEAVELAHRLPRVWARVVARELPGWRARRIARATMVLSREAARFVDAQVAPFAHKIGPAATDRLIDEAIIRFMPEQAKKDRGAALQRLHFTVDHRQVSTDGTSRVTGELDLADALDLDAAVTAEAAQLGQISDLPLGARRAKAVAHLARGDQALDLVIYVHLNPEGDSAQVEARGVRRTITVDQVREWCATGLSRVTVRPVIDLAGTYTSSGYQPSDTLREQVIVRDRTCVFPWCTRPAWDIDLDHTQPHAAGGATSSENLAPLCRRHHRLKTFHSGWNYTHLDPGSYLWRSPHGYHYLRDQDGTAEVTHPKRE